MSIVYQKSEKMLKIELLCGSRELRKCAGGFTFFVLSFLAGHREKNMLKRAWGSVRRGAHFFVFLPLAGVLQGSW